MAHRNAIISLPAFLDKYFDKRQMDKDQIHRYYTIAADGLRDLHIYHLPIVKAVPLTIEGTNFTADFPDDYINYVLLAVEDSGEWWTFTRRKNMVSKSIAGISGGDLTENDYVTGPGSVGGKNAYYFNVNHSNRTFEFDEAYTGQVVVLKYKSSGVEATTAQGSSPIEFPIYAESALETFITWQIAEMDKEGLSERQWKHRLYKTELQKMRNINQPKIREIRDLWANSSNQTIIRI